MNTNQSKESLREPKAFSSTSDADQLIWSFVNRVVFIDSELLPFQIAPDISLAKAGRGQTTYIKQHLAEMLGCSQENISRHFEKHRVPDQRDEVFAESKKVPGVFVHMNQEDWRYYIVRTRGMSTKRRLQLASNLSSFSIDLSISAPHDFSWTSRSGPINEYYRAQEPWKDVRKISKYDLEDLASAYNDVSSITQVLDQEFPELIRAITMLDNLTLLPANSDFQILGLFAIIEMLISHSPKQEDRGDSITHQLKSKIPLICNRFSKPFDISTFFLNAKSDKIWGALYSLRSTFAHGGLPDFNDMGKHKLLKDQGHAQEFLTELVKRLVRQAIREPQLFRDLREC